MNKHKVIRNLEMDQIEFVKSLLEQLHENGDGLNDYFYKYLKTKNKNDLTMFSHEYQRLQKRQEAMFNLTKQLLSEIDENVGKAMNELYKLEEGND